MAVNYFSLMWITASTVLKVILCCVVGMFISRYFGNRAQSEKGFTYICVRVMLPLMLFSNLCLSVTWESVRLYFWAPVIATFPIITGVLGACLCRLYLNSTYTGMLILGCAFQNGLTYPVSLILNLKGISWFGPEEVEVALAHFFLYNIVCSIGLWAIGEPVIKHFKALEVAEEKAELERQRREHVAARGGEARTSSFNTGVTFPFSTVTDEKQLNDAAAPHYATAFQQFAWYRPADPEDAPLALSTIETGITAEGDVVATPEEGGRFSPLVLCQALMKMLEAMKSPTVSGSLLAIFISLVPPLRWLAETMPGGILLSGFALIGSGAIPLQLLVLGATVLGSKSEEPAEGEAEELKSWTELLQSQQSLFIISSITIRLVIVPAVCFAAIHVLSTNRIIPSDRVFILSMFIGTCCPSAINSSIICVMHDYHARDYSQMIFVMYVSAIFFTTVWLFIYILYLN